MEGSGVDPEVQRASGEEGIQVLGESPDPEDTILAEIHMAGNQAQVGKQGDIVVRKVNKSLGTEAAEDSQEGEPDEEPEAVGAAENEEDPGPVPAATCSVHSY